MDGLTVLITNHKDIVLCGVAAIFLANAALLRRLWYYDGRLIKIHPSTMDTIFGGLVTLELYLVIVFAAVVFW